MKYTPKDRCVFPFSKNNENKVFAHTGTHLQSMEGTKILLFFKKNSPSNCVKSVPLCANTFSSHLFVRLNLHVYFHGYVADVALIERYLE